MIIFLRDAGLVAVVCAIVWLYLAGLLAIHADWWRFDERRRQARIDRFLVGRTNAWRAGFRARHPDLARYVRDVDEQP